MIFWILLILYGSFQGFFLALFFGFSKNIIRLRKILLVGLILSLSLLSADFALMNLFLLHLEASYWGIGWVGPLWMLISPLFYFLFRVYMKSNFQLGWKHFLHFLPFIFFTITNVQFILLPLDAREDYMLAYSAGEEFSLLHLISKIIFHFQVLYYPLRLVQIMRQNSIAFSSFLSIINLGLLTVGIASFVQLICFNLFRFSIAWLTSTFHIISLTLFVHVTAFLLILRPEWIKKPLKHSPFSEKYIYSNLKNVDRAQLQKGLHELMVQQKIYLKQNLTLSDLANQLAVSKHQLSEFLNKENKQSFNEYVNSFRIKEVQKRLLDSKNSQYTIEGIALEVGFRSTATFYRSFKKHTGSTPTKWLNTRQ